MNIAIGKPAPTFRVDAYRRGKSTPVSIDLESYRGRWVVLFFYPADFTFVCPTELRMFAALEPLFGGEDAVLMAASTDGFHSHRAWFETDDRLADVEYPVLADRDQRLSAAYGVLNDDGTAHRGTFIIDPGGILRHVSVNDSSIGRAAQETLRLLRALRTGELCPVEWQPGEPTLGLAA